MAQNNLTCSNRPRRPSMLSGQQIRVLNHDLPIHKIMVNLCVSAGSRFRIKPTCLFLNYSRQALAPGFEARQDQLGRTYYLDHGTRTTNWDRPLESIVRSRMNGHQERLFAMLLSETIHYASQYRTVNATGFIWGFSVYVQGSNIFWPESIDNLGANPMQPAQIGGMVNQSQSAATYIVLEVIKFLIRDEFPTLPSGTGLPPYSNNELPDYSPAYRSDLGNHRIPIVLEISDCINFFKLSPASMFPRFASSPLLSTRYEMSEDFLGRVYYLDHARQITRWERPAAAVPQHVNQSFIRGLLRLVSVYSGDFMDAGLGWTGCSLNLYVQAGHCFVGGIDDRTDYYESRLLIDGPLPNELRLLDESDRMKIATNNLLQIIKILSGSETFTLPAMDLPPYDVATLPTYIQGEQGRLYREMDHHSSTSSGEQDSVAGSSVAADEERQVANSDDSESSESESERRRRLRRNAAAANRELENDEEREERLERERRARILRHEAEDEGEAERRRENLRMQMRDLRVQEPAEVAEADRHANRIAHEEARGRVPALYRAAFNYEAGGDLDLVAPLNIGRMTKICLFCRAKTFYFNHQFHEPDGICCESGKVRVPVVQEPPPEIVVWYSQDRPEHREFLRNICRYNARFAMTSFGCGQGRRTTGWDPCFTIRGQVYHRIGTLLPAGEEHSFLQIYFLGEDDQLERRMNIDDEFGRDSVVPSTLRIFQNFLNRSNRLVNAFKTTLEIMQQNAAGAENVAERVVIRSDRVPHGQHPGRYNAPTGDEISILIVNAERADSRDIVLYLRAGGLQRINEMNPSYDALQYPLIFWRGNETYTYGAIRMHHPHNGQLSNRFVTTHAYYAYLLQVREGEHDNFLLKCGRLLNQFIVDMWAKVEAERLLYLRLHQSELRAADYIHLHDALMIDGDGANVGQRVILPSSFIGGPRHMQQYMQDALALVRAFGRPSLFITMTCNPNWVEITQNLFANQQPTDRYDIIARVFQLKVRKLIKMLHKDQLFGASDAYIYSIEWQKRGLPHIHLILWLREQLRPENIDQIISAEIPDAESDPELFELVTRHMVHGPCGNLDQGQSCMQPPSGNPTGRRSCTKNFPKPFFQETTTNQDGYPSYRRRRPDDGGQTATVMRNGRESTIDNTWIVPYCMFLMRVFKCHMDVEFCASIGPIKYLFGYIMKGCDMAAFHTERLNAGEAVNRLDEITSYQEARFLSASEGAWHFYSFSIHGRFPAILQLHVHLENHQRVYFREDNARLIAEGPMRRTTLTSFFELCSRDPDGTVGLLYTEVPRHYTYTADRGFQLRIDQSRYQIGRMYTVHPNVGECYYLRVLLLHRPGPKGFEDIKTINGHMHATFRDTCHALGLLENDSHWIEAMREACEDRRPPACRLLFAIILCHSAPANPMDLWLRFRDRLSEDILYNFRQRNLEPQINEIYNECLIRIEDLTLSMMNKSFGEAPEQIPLPRTNRDRRIRVNPEIAREMNYNRQQLMDFCNERAANLTQEQRDVFDEIYGCIRRQEGGMFFLDAPGGTGKTFLMNMMLARVRGEGKIILACASSGIAATLMDGGRTAHSMFGIPIRHQSVPMCAVSRGTNKAELFEQSVAIIWDEVTMSKKWDIEAVDRTMRDIRRNDDYFGGLVVLFAGDFRQTLPIIPSAPPAACIDACLKFSHLWPRIRKLRLTRNMRVHIHREAGAADFCARLLRIGMGNEPTNVHGMVPLRVGLCISLGSIDALIDAVYPDLPANIGNYNWLCKRAILAPINTEVDDLNYKIQSRLPPRTESRVYLSINACLDPNQEALFPLEVLNNFNISNFPAHRLEISIGSPLIVIRNINPPNLCNGTRVVVVALRPNVIVANILTGPGVGTQVYIPRITLNSEDDFAVRFRRRQFPVRLAYVLTINKAQGQTLQVAGLNLFDSSCFAHGQLYVACSRVGRSSNLFIATRHGATRNVVHPQVL